MASLKLDHIYKVYPNGVKAVNDFTMNIEDGEFIVFVGPSGCGKSTTLRMIAGLEEISAGELYIGDTLVNDMEPKDRDIAMVFQNYALYPHMTVYENMAFGLTLRHMPRNEIHEKVMWAAENLGLKEYLDRKPKAMSGGQRQRVSLGRAILRNPKVMLLDEPLSNLDAKLRSQMRSVISKLHKSLATTFIYVTHDQVEAMTLGTRVVVMKAGRVQQIDAPQNLYDHPVNKFVAGFIGTPQMNFFNVTLTKKGNEVLMKWCDAKQPDIHLPLESVIRANKRYLDGTKEVIFGIRCEGLSIEPEVVKNAKNVIDVKVSHFEELGNETLVYGDLGNDDRLFGDSKTAVIIKAKSKYGHEAGDVIKVAVSLDNLHLFDSQTEMTIIPLVPSESVLPVKVNKSALNICDAKITKPEAITVDSLDGLISIPLSSVSLSKDGDIEGIVGRVDTLKEGCLVYVNLGEHIIFVKSDKAPKVGSTVKVCVDYSKVVLMDKEENVVQASLPERDTVMASFVNYKTAYETTHDETFKAISDARVAEVEATYASKVAEAEKVLADRLASIDEKALPEIVSKNNELLAVKTKEINDALKASKAEAAKANKEEAKNYAKLKKEAVKAIEDEYKSMVEKEKADVALIKATNKDKDVVRARVAQFTTFKETLPITKNNDINNKLNALSFDHDTVLNSVRSKLVREQFDLKSELKELKAKVERENDPKKFAEADHEATLKVLEKEHNEALLNAKLLFFFKLSDSFQLIPEEITNKIIQGLGNKVFTKTFKICVPHDGFRVTEGKGLVFEVVEEINYKTRNILRLKGTMNGQEVVLNMDKVGELKKGDSVHIEFDIEKCEIYEGGMNIRLY